MLHAPSILEFYGVDIRIRGYKISSNVLAFTQYRFNLTNLTGSLDPIIFMHIHMPISKKVASMTHVL